MPTTRIATAPEHRAALELALSSLRPEARGPLVDTLATLGDHRLGPFDALAVIVERGSIEAAAWAQPTPGGAAVLWAPEWRPPRPPGATDAEHQLIATALHACDRAGVPMVQALLERPDDPRTPALLAAGMRKIASLEYLALPIRAQPIRRAPAASELASKLSFEPYQESQHARLKRVIKQTYSGSLDCPGLDELRGLDDVIASYRATGSYDPRHWRLVQENEEDVGVLLVNEHPDVDQAELIYMGLTPAARGKGYGLRIVEQAIAIAGEMGVDQLMAAVDCENWPARRTYGKLGFAPWTERHAFVRGNPDHGAVS